MADNIKVVIKVRPLIKREIDDNQQSLWKVSDKTIYPIEQPGNSFYTFDSVFGETSQTQDVYDKVAREIVDAAVDGINGTIFAYGQTSSGKTFTMMGDDESPGVIPLAVQNIFSTIESKVDRDFLLRVSYIEIYNEKIRDLLDVTKTDLKVHEDLQGQTSVKCTEEVTSTADQVLKLMRKGDQNRSTGETQMNERSSRSHTIFQIIIESRKHVSEMSQEENCVNVSQLNLVDLAGSERASQTSATKLRLREGGIINRSLCTLSLVIRQLSDAQGDTNRFISFRDSKLTRILQTSLGGNTKTGIICAVTPATLDETHSTLMFALRAKDIKNKPKVNEVMSDATQLKRLTKEMALLQNELQTRKHLEVDMMKMQEQIAKMKNQIVMGYVAYVPASKVDSQRRKTWAAPRHSLSSLTPIQEDCAHIDFTFNRFQSTNEHRLQRLSNVTERDDSVLSQGDSTASCLGGATPKESKKLFPPDEVICLDDSNISEKSPSCSPTHRCYINQIKPPCILMRENRYIRRELTELEELTSLEQKYPYEMNDLLKQICELRQSQSLSQERLTENDEKIKVLSKQIEVLTEDKNLAEKLKAESEKKMNVFQCENTDLLFQMDQLKDRSQKRENELLLSLKEARGDNRNPTSQQNSFYHNFLNMSQDISLAVNSDGEPSLADVSSDLQSLLPSVNNAVNVISQMEKEAPLNNGSIDCYDKLGLLKIEDSDFTTQINNLKLEIDSKNLEIDQLKSDILELTSARSENETLKASVFAFKDNINKLSSDKALYELKMEEQGKIITESRDSLMELQMQFESLNEKYILIEKKFTESEECISYLDTEIECKSRLIELLEKEVSSYESVKNDCINVNKLLMRSEEERNALVNITEALQSSLNEKQSEIEELNTKLQSAGGRISDMVTEIAMKDDELKEKEHRIQISTDEIANIQLGAEENILNKSKEISELKLQIELLNNNLNNIESADRKIDSCEINELVTVNEHLTKKLSSVEENNKELFKNIAAGEEIVANNVSEICQLKVLIDTLNGELSTLRYELEKNMEALVEMAQMKQYNSELLDKVQAQEEAIAKISTNVPELQNTIDTLNNTITNLQFELQQNEQNSQVEINQLKNDYDIIVEKLSSVEENTRKLTEQIDAHENMTNKLDELSDLKQKNDSLNNQIALLQSTLENQTVSQVEVSRLKTENNNLTEKLLVVEDCNDSLLKKIVEYEETVTSKSKNISDLQSSIIILNNNISRLESDLDKNDELSFDRNENIELRREIDHLKQENQKNTLLVEGLNIQILNNKNFEVQNNILNNLENNKENVQKPRRKSAVLPSPIKLKLDIKRLSTPKSLSESVSDIPELNDKIIQLNASLKTETELSEILKEKVSVLENTNNEMKNLLQTVKKELMEFNCVLSQFKDVVFCNCEDTHNMKSFIDWFSELTRKGLCVAIENYSFNDLETDQRTCINVSNPYSTNSINLERSFENNNVKVEKYSKVLATIEHNVIAICQKLNMISVLELQNNIPFNNDNENIQLENVLSLHSLFLGEIEKKIYEGDELLLKNESLTNEMEEVRLSIEELVKESEELQRKILGQRSDQSVSVAEFTLLTSRLSAMQHYHSNLHAFSASTVTHVSQELYALQTILQNQSLYERDSNDISFQLFNNKCQQIDQSSQVIEEFSENNLEDASCQTDMADSTMDTANGSATDTIQNQVKNYEQLMLNFQSKCNENTDLMNKISQFERDMNAFKTLQNEYDSLSMEFMEILQEIDALKEKNITNDQRIEKNIMNSSVQAVTPLTDVSIQTSPCQVNIECQDSHNESNFHNSELLMHNDTHLPKNIKADNLDCSTIVGINNMGNISKIIKSFEEEIKCVCRLSNCKCPENIDLRKRLNMLPVIITDLPKSISSSIDSILQTSYVNAFNMSLTDNNDLQSVSSQVEDDKSNETIQPKMSNESIESTLTSLFDRYFDSIKSKNLSIIKNIQEELCHSKEVITSLQSELDSKINEIADYQMDSLKSSDDLKNQLVELNKQCSSLNQTIDNYKNDISSISKELISERSLNEILLQEKNHSKSQIEELLANILRLENIEAELKMSVNTLEAQKEVNTDQNNSTNNELINLKHHINSLENQLASIMTTEAKLSAIITMRDDEIRSIKQKVDSLTENNNMLIEKGNDNDLTITTLNQKLKVHVSKIEELEMQLTKTDNDYKYSDDKYKNILEENNKYKMEIQSLHESATVLEARISTDEIIKSEVMAQVNKLKCDLEELYRVKQELLDENNNSNMIVSKLTEDNLNLKERISAGEIINSEVMAHVDKLKCDLEESYHVKQKLLDENNNASMTVSKLTEENFDLKEKISASENIKSEVMAHLNKLKCDLEESDRIKQELLDENNNANAIVSKLTKENLDLKESMTYHSRKLKEANDELSESSQANMKKIMRLESDISEKECNINEQMSKISELTLKVYNQSQEIENINIQMKHKEEELCSLLSNIEGMSVLLNEKEQETDDMSRKLRDMKSISDDLCRLQTENTELLRRIANSELINGNLKANLSSLTVYKDNHDKIIGEFELLKQEMEIKERKLLELTSINTILQTRADDLQAELNLMLKNSPRARNDLKLRRQSMHDMKRNISLNNSSSDAPMDVDIDPMPEDNELLRKNSHLEEHLKSMGTKLENMEEEYNKLSSKHQECEKHLNERSAAYNKVVTSYKILESKLAESKRSQLSSPAPTTQDATTNTITDRSEPLMAFCVDKMTHEAVKEKSKQLQKKNEDLSSKNKELCIEIRRLQHSLQNNTVHNLLPNNDRTQSEDLNLLEKIKNMESIVSQKDKEIKELEIKYSDLDNECDLCVKELRDREDDCANMYKEKKLLEAEVENLKYEINSCKKDSPSREMQRKRQNMYDANRSISANSIDYLGKTQEDSQSLKTMKETCKKLQVNLDTLKNHNKELLAEMQTLKTAVTRSTEESNIDSNAFSLNMPRIDRGVQSAAVPGFYMPIPMALPHLEQNVHGGIVQTQRLSEYMAENKKLKDTNEKLRVLCHRRAAKIKHLEETKPNK